MLNIKSTISAVVLVSGLLAFACTAQAQVPQAFVSALSGDDANPCTVREPCRSFKQALSQVQAKGKVIVLDSGDYDPFKIAQAVSVEAAPGVYAGIVTPVGVAVTVNAGAADVVSLRGLTLVGVGGAQGVSFTSGGSLHVEGCLISGFNLEGIRFTAAGKLFVKDTTVRNSGQGIMIDVASGAATAAIDHCRLEKNSIAGLNVAYNARVTARDTVALGNGGSGFRLIANTAGVTSELTIENCLAAGNFSGIHSEGGSGASATVRVSNSTVTNNEKGLFSTGSVQGSILSRGNNTVEGNVVNGFFTGTFNAQ